MHRDAMTVELRNPALERMCVGDVASLGCGVTPVVRTRGWDDLNASVLLDNGVLGIIAPDISTAAVASITVVLRRQRGFAFATPS